MVKEIDSSLENKKKSPSIIWKVINVIMFVVVLVGLAVLLSRDNNPSSSVVEKTSSAVTTGDNNVSVVSEGNMVYFELTFVPWTSSIDKIKILMQSVSKWEKENQEKQVVSTTLILSGDSQLGMFIFYR